MKNLKIGKKLSITFGIIIVFFIMTILVSLYSLNSTGNNFEKFYKVGYPVSLKSTEMRASMQTALKNLSQAMITEDLTKTNDFVTEARENFQKVSDGFEYLKQNFQGDKSVLDQAQGILDEASSYQEQIFSLASQNKNEEASKLLFDNLQPLMMKFTEKMLEIDSLTAEMADEDYNKSKSSQDITVLIVFIVSIAVLVLTIWLAIYITRSLTRPIFEIEEAAKEMAQGHLSVSINYESKDELGSLSENMRIMTKRIKVYMDEIAHVTQQMAQGHLDVKKREEFLGDFLPVQMAIRSLVNSLNDALEQINQSADQVADGSDQVSSGAQALSQGATEQASSVEELAATISDISNQVRETADNADNARSQTVDVGEQVALCNQQMEDMISAISEISDKSNEIGKIIRTIEDIAFQTNILALNAAVEAARAGEAGKGFAVVADEVRNLASKTAEESKNTSGLIEGSIIAVEKGTKIANEAAKTMAKVVDGTQNVENMVEKIASAAMDQSNSITQVNQGVDQISSVVQNNSATAEESAAASEELSGLAQTLKSAVSKFKLRNKEQQVFKDSPQETTASYYPADLEHSSDKY